MHTLLVLLATAGNPGEAGPDLSSLAAALSFHASFDGSANADFGHGDLRIYRTQRGLEQAESGLPNAAVHLAKKRGRLGGALAFTDKTTTRIFFKAEENLRYRSDNWSGTLSFWLNVDPEKDLKPGFCDQIQVTDKTWNKAALWVDFSKDEVPRHFRYGAFADYAVWNPTNRKFEEIAPSERPWIVVERPPFGRGKWTHVVMTFSWLQPLRHRRSGEAVPRRAAPRRVEGPTAGFHVGHLQDHDLPGNRLHRTHGRSGSLRPGSESPGDQGAPSPAPGRRGALQIESIPMSSIIS